MSAASTTDGPTDAVPVEPARPVEQRAEELLNDGNAGAAREVIEEALSTTPSSPDLLWLLAKLEFAYGSWQAAISCLAEAASASGGTAAAISRQIRALCEHHLWDAALTAAQQVPTRIAREAIEKDLSTSPGRQHLLRILAELEFADGNQQAGVRRLREAANASGGDAEFFRRQIRTLSKHDLWRETLMTIERLPAPVLQDRQVAWEVGSFYHARRCYAHAANAFRDSKGLLLLSPSDRAKRRGSWLRSGGPFTFMRQKLNAWESQLLTALRTGQRAADQLDGVPGLDGREAQRMKVGIENGNYEWLYQHERWNAAIRWMLRCLPTGSLPVWLVLYAIVNISAFISGPPGAVGGTAISAVVAVGISSLLIRSRLFFAPRWFYFIWTIAAGSEIAVAEGYYHHVLPTAGWWAWVVFGLVLVPTIMAGILILATILTALMRRGTNSAVRRYCQAQLLYTFLSILRDLQSQSRQVDFGQRMALSSLLEQAATWMSRDLLPSASLDGLGSGDWLRQRTAGWAEELRYMQRQIIAPVPGSQPRLEAKLQHEIRCLVTGDLGALAWRQPPPAPSRRTSLARKTIEILRTVLVAALPLSVILVGQAVMHFSSGVFRWASVATGIWALLYVIISLDPAISEKIATARSLADTLNEVRTLRLPIPPRLSRPLAGRGPLAAKTKCLKGAPRFVGPA